MNLEKMRQLKREQGYTNEQIAQDAGLPLGTVQKIFSGETKCPRRSTLQALERFFLKEENGSFPGVAEAAVEYYASRRPGEYTLEDYYSLPDDRRAELIDGVFYDMSSPTFVHQEIAAELYTQIKDYIRKKGGSCIPLLAPLDVRLDCDNKTLVQPDVITLCDRSKIRRWGIDGAPDFLAEILSPATRRKDLSIKLSKYMAAGVREYWMIDPDKRKLLIYRLEREDFPEMYGLTGKAHLGIYEDLFIDLDAINAVIREYPED